MKIPENKFYMGLAAVVSQLSRANNLKVGAVLVKDNNILAFGFNGTPAGRDNACEVEGVTKLEVLHAEENAILKVARSTQSTEGSTLYTTARPCLSCARNIVAAGIERVVYRDLKDGDREPLDFLKECGVDVEQTQYRYGHEEKEENEEGDQESGC